MYCAIALYVTVANMPPNVQRVNYSVCVDRGSMPIFMPQEFIVTKTGQESQRKTDIQTQVHCV